MYFHNEFYFHGRIWVLLLFFFFLIRVGVIILKCLKSHFGVKLYKRRDGCRGTEPAKLSTRAQIDSYVSVHDANQQGDEIMKPRMTGTCQTANSWSTDWWVWRKNWSDRESDWGCRCVQWPGWPTDSSIRALKAEKCSLCILCCQEIPSHGHMATTTKGSDYIYLHTMLQICEPRVGIKLMSAWLIDISTTEQIEILFLKINVLAS